MLKKLLSSIKKGGYIIKNKSITKIQSLASLLVNKTMIIKFPIDETEIHIVKHNLENSHYSKNIKTFSFWTCPNDLKDAKLIVFQTECSLFQICEIDDIFVGYSGIKLCNKLHCNMQQNINNVVVKKYMELENASDFPHATSSHILIPTKELHDFLEKNKIKFDAIVQTDKLFIIEFCSCLIMTKLKLLSDEIIDGALIVFVVQSIKMNS